MTADRLGGCAVFQRTLRPYPLCRGSTGQARPTDRRVDVAPGDVVSVWPRLPHRHRNLWAIPTRLRWSASPGSRHRYQYLPFGAGPRTCVGAQFATTEALTLLAHWLNEWRFVDIGHPVQPAGMVTLRPKGGLPLRLERR
jgi:cytochrome P450